MCKKVILTDLLGRRTPNTQRGQQTRELGHFSPQDHKGRAFLEDGLGMSLAVQQLRLCRGCGFKPWPGNQDPACLGAAKEKKKKEEEEEEERRQSRMGNARESKTG